MKNQKTIYWIVIAALVVVIAVFLVLIINQNTEKASEPEKTTYVLPPAFVKSFFNSSVNDFFSSDFTFYKYCEDYRTDATIDKDGNLVIRLTKGQEEGMLTWLNDCVGRARSAGIEISDDYTHLTYVCTMEEFFSNCPFLMHYELGFRQLFSGKDPALISVRYTIIAKTTKKVICDISFPENEINVDGNDPEWY